MDVKGIILIIVMFALMVCALFFFAVFRSKSGGKWKWWQSALGLLACLIPAGALLLLLIVYAATGTIAMQTLGYDITRAFAFAVDCIFLMFLAVLDYKWYKENKVTIKEGGGKRVEFLIFILLDLFFIVCWIKDGMRLFG